jgi:hypothetical protein
MSNRPRRRLIADTIHIETAADTVFFYNAYDKLGSVSQNLHGTKNQVFLTEEALDDLYEALKQREAHKKFLAAKYGDNA